MTAQACEPRYIRLDPNDAIVVNDLAACKDPFFLRSRRWKDLIDFDAGRIATGEASIEETGWDLFRLILDVASGRTKVWSDRWGIHNDLALFTPGPVA